MFRVTLLKNHETSWKFNTLSFLYARRPLLFPMKLTYTLALLIIPFSAEAETAVEQLPAYQVQSKPLLISHSTANKQSFISQGDLDTLKSFDINASLYRLPSVMIGQNKSYGYSRATVRGVSGGVGLVSFDGVPLFANFSGLYSMRHFPREVVDNIQVQRGFEQNISNSRTLGGSINLQSRRVADHKTHFSLEGGSQATINSSLAVGLGDQDENVSLVVGYTHIADGDTQSGIPSPIDDPDNYKMGRALLRADKTFSRGSLQASFYYVNGHEQTDGPGLTPDFKVSWLEDPNGWLNDEVIVSQVTGVYEFSDSWQSRLQLAYTRDTQQGALGTFRPAVPLGPFSINLTSELALLDWQNQHLLALPAQDLSANIGWGVQVQYQNAETTENNLQEDHVLASPNLLFALIDKQWRIQLKTQWDIYQDYGAHLTYALGAEWSISPEVVLWANTGTHYRAPGVNERLHPLFGDTQLQPEQNIGAEVGLNWDISAQTHVELSAYWQDFNNMIVLALNADTGAIQSGNVAAAQVSGVDLTLRQQWLDNWSNEFNYSYMHAINQTTQQKLAGRPAHRMSLTNDWAIIDPLHWLVVFNIHNGLWHDTDNTLYSGTVIRLQTTLNYQATESIELYVKADNLTDDRHSELSGFQAPRRSFYGGINIKL